MYPTDGLHWSIGQLPSTSLHSCIRFDCMQLPQRVSTYAEHTYLRARLLQDASSAETPEGRELLRRYLGETGILGVAQDSSLLAYARFRKDVSP